MRRLKIEPKFKKTNSAHHLSTHFCLFDLLLLFLDGFVSTVMTKMHLSYFVCHISATLCSFICFSVHRWWKFAIDCHLSVIQDRRMRCQWQFAVSRARDIVHYIDAYRSCLTAGSRYVTRAQKVSYGKYLDFGCYARYCF